MILSLAFEPLTFLIVVKSDGSFPGNVLLILSLILAGLQKFREVLRLIIQQRDFVDLSLTKFASKAMNLNF